MRDFLVESLDAVTGLALENGQFANNLLQFRLQLTNNFLQLCLLLLAEIGELLGCNDLVFDDWCQRITGGGADESAILPCAAS